MRPSYPLAATLRILEQNARLASLAPVIVDQKADDDVRIQGFQILPFLNARRSFSRLSSVEYARAAFSASTPKTSETFLAIG